MKRGQQLHGQFGAILDGTKVTQAFDPNSTSIVRGWNCADCSGVTIRNLVIRNLAEHNCVGAYGANSGGWTVDHNEISGCRWGVAISESAGGRVTFNSIHHNNAPGPAESGGYGSYLVSDMLWEGNEIGYNGRTQKIVMTRNATFRNNFVHHNGNGIWYDGDNTGSLIEGNLVEDHAEQGIFYEKSGQGVIRNNIIRRSGLNGVFLSTSRDVELHGNTLEGNYRAITAFLYCGDVFPPGQPYAEAIGWDLRGINAHDNTIIIDSTSGALANGLSYTSCSPAAVLPYSSGQKNIRFTNNSYVTATSLGASLFVWADSTRTFTGWQQAGQDASGTIRTGTGPAPVTVGAPGRVRITP